MTALHPLSSVDADDVAYLYDRCVDYFLLQDGEPPTLADAQALFTDLPAGKEAHDQSVFGWTLRKRLRAIIAILRDYPDDGVWYLGFMLIDPRQRGHGVGRSLYRKVEQWAVAQGAVEVRLAVLEQNEAATRFWHSLGFSTFRRVGPDRFKARDHHRTELRRFLDH
ncbi:GNAT family N-acetyltransferase [Sphingomonas sp.]|uniref:GNAT family N-acetyltransferase n=1 Tax=Sphingomonas sp. TaxID=28214 RepID=UPI003B39FABF